MGAVAVWAGAPAAGADAAVSLAGSGFASGAAARSGFGAGGVAIGSAGEAAAVAVVAVAGLVRRLRCIELHRRRFHHRSGPVDGSLNRLLHRYFVGQLRPALACCSRVLGLCRRSCPAPWRAHCR